MAVNKKNTGGIKRARRIANSNKTPIEKAQTFIGREVPVFPVDVKPVPRPTPQPELPVRTPGKEPVYIPPIKDGKPNQEFIRTIPPPPPKPEPGRPLPESPIKTVVDKIIEDSNEIVKEIETKTDPQRPPVVPQQDIVTPPPAITPTEILLENQKNCEKDVEIPNINIVNEFNPVIDLSSNASASAAVVVEAPRIGCTDPDAINYDPAARIDDGSCKFEPVEVEEPVTTVTETPRTPVDIPAITPFVDSHGTVLFEIERELVDQTENTDTPGVIILPNGEEITADLELVDEVDRPALDDSDLIFTEAEKEVAERAAIRKELGGELANDNKLPSDQDIVLIGDRESIKEKLIRNNRGVIVLSMDKNPKLQVSLQGQSFNYKQYKNTIDTDFSELIGKL